MVPSLCAQAQGADARSRDQLPAPPLPETLHSRRADARPSQPRNAALLPAGSTSFRLPDNSVLSPDASLVALDRWQALSDAERRGSLPSAPIWWWSLRVPAT